MKKFLMLVLSLFLGLFTSCGNDSTDTNKCPHECKAYEECNEKQECVLKEGMCEKDSDCPSDKPVCDANECISASNECNPACDETFQTCIDGACETKEGMCSDDKDCTDGKKCNENHYCADVNTDVITIRQLKDTAVEGEKYTVEGIVTALDDDGFFMQDESQRGIYVYQNLGNDSYSAQKKGDFVRVSGVYKIYYGLNELTYFLDEENPENTISLDIETLSENNKLPEFKEIDADVKTLENFESMLVRLKNPDFTVVKVPAENDVTNHNYTIEDSNNKPFFLFDSIYKLDLKRGDVLTQVQGVLTYNHDKYKLIPRQEGDVKKKELICNPECNDLEECKSVDGVLTCVLKDGMCATQEDCNDNQTCENNVCVDNEPVNLVPNGDLETWISDDEPENWIFEYDNQALTTAQKENLIVYEGRFSAKVKKTSAEENDSGKKNEFLSPAFEIDTTMEYDISMMLYDNDVNAKARIYFKFYDETGHSNGMTNMSNFYTTNYEGWKEYKYPSSWSIYAGLSSEEIDTIKTMRVGIRLYDDEGSDTGYIYIDDVKVLPRQ